jgi:hypothetical protein
MPSLGFGQLKAFSSHLTGRALVLRLDYFPGKGALQTKRAPRPVCEDIFGVQLEQEQIGHDRHRDRALHPIDFLGDLMLAQAHHPFEFVHQQLDLPPSQVDAGDLPCRHRLRQIGHQDCGLWRPIVAPPYPLSVHPNGAAVFWELAVGICLRRYFQQGR